MRVSADIFNQERFHIWKVLMKKLKKKEKEKLYVRWGVYNSLHWWISSSELLKKTTQAMKKFFICKPYLYEAEKHMSTDIDNHTTTFSEA